MKRKIAFVLALILFFLAANGIGYEYAFSRIRTDVPEDHRPELEAFLTEYAIPLVLPREDRKTADALLYSGQRQNEKPSALVVFVPGMGATSLHYVSLIRAFLSQGYAVLSLEDLSFEEMKAHLRMLPEESTLKEARRDASYDGGLPEVLIRLRAAFDYIENSETFQGLPVYLFGHSRGAYAAGAMLSEVPADAAVLISAFDSSKDMLQEKAYDVIGPVSWIFYPAARLYEYAKFGADAKASVTEGSLTSSAPVLLIQGLDDKTVPPEKGILLFEESLEEDPDVIFIPLDHTGHTPEFDGPLKDLILDFLAAPPSAVSTSVSGAAK